MVKQDIISLLVSAPVRTRMESLLQYARARCEFMKCPFTTWLLMDEAYNHQADMRDAAMAEFKKWCLACKEPRSLNNAARFILRREGLL